jgi:hypothetical protein
MTARSRLPNRRLAETFSIEVAGLRYTATIGRYPDGRKALCRDSHGRPSGPLGAALDRIAEP